jgi:hypothetical protein
MRLSSSNRFVGDPLIEAIAHTTDEEIRLMSRRDLLDVIRLSRGLKSPRFVPSSLQDVDGDLLVDFALLARDRCRARLRRCRPPMRRQAQGPSDRAPGAITTAPFPQLSDAVLL